MFKDLTFYAQLNKKAILLCGILFCTLLCPLPPILADGGDVTFVSDSPTDDPIILTDGASQCFSVELAGAIGFETFYTDISGTGTALGSGDDAVFDATLPFPFPIYGGTYTMVEVSTNGFISMGDNGAGSDLGNSCPGPDGDAVGDRIYLLHDDLDLEAGIGTLFQQDFSANAAGHPRHPSLGTNIDGVIFQWDDVRHCCSGPTWDMQVILYANGDFLLLYDPDGTEPECGISATIGTQNQAGTELDYYTCNNAVTNSCNNCLQQLALFNGALLTNYQITWTGPDGIPGDPQICLDTCITFTANAPCALEEYTVSYVVECLDNTGAIVPNFSITGDFTIQITPPTVVSQTPTDDPIILTDGANECFELTVANVIPVNFVSSLSSFSHYTDISGTGTALGSGDDQVFDATLPFAFPIYGGTYTMVEVSSNGFISMGDNGTTSDLTNTCPGPDGEAVGDRIYLLHDDLDLEAGIGTLFQQDFSANAAGHPGHPSLGTNIDGVIFQWDDVAHWPGSSTATIWDMQVILYANGDFLLLYDPAGTELECGISATMGTQNQAGTIVNYYTCNNTVTDGTNGCLQELAILYSAFGNYQVTWTGPDGVPLPPSSIPSSCFNFDLADPCIPETQTVSYLLECLDNTGTPVPNAGSTASFNIQVNQDPAVINDCCPAIGTPSATATTLCCQESSTITTPFDNPNNLNYDLAYLVSPVADGLVTDMTTYNAVTQIDVVFATNNSSYLFLNDCILPEGDYYVTPFVSPTGATPMPGDVSCQIYSSPVVITISYCCPTQGDVIPATGNNNILCTDVDNGNTASLPTVLVTGNNAANATYTWTQTTGTAITVPTGPTPTVTFVPNTACTPEVYTFALTIGCTTDPTVNLDGGTVSHTLYPAINSHDNVIVGNGACCPTIDLQCPEEYIISHNLGGTRTEGDADCSTVGIQGAFSYFVTLSNPPANLFQSRCLEQFYPVNYDCRACPIVTTEVNWSETLCEGGQMNLTGAAATVSVTDPSSFATVVSFWLDAAFTQAASSIPVYTGTGCEVQNQTIYAAIGCDRSGDGQPEEFVPAGDFPLTLYPQPIAPQINQTSIDETNNQCTYEVVPACPNDVLDVSNFGPLPTPTAANTIPIQVTSNVAGTSCSPRTFQVAYASCSICDFDMTVDLISQGENGGVTPFFQNHAQITIVGGLLPYTLNWDRSGLVRYNTRITSNPDGLVIDIFYADQSFWSVTATDATGVCEQTQSSNVGNSDLLNITNSSITGASDQNTNDGSIAITVAGGTSPYNYAWTGPLGYSELVTGDATGSNLMTGLHYGWYNVVVSDAGGDSTFGWFWVAPNQDSAAGGFIRGKGDALTQPILQAQPNPFAIQTEFTFALPTAANQVEVAVYSLNGQKVATLYQDAMEGQTPYTVAFNAEDLPAGVYIVQLTSNTGEQVQEKVVLVH